MLIFVYAAGIIFYIHYKQRQRKKEKDPEMNATLSTDNGSTLGSRIDLDNVMLKTNPLLKMDNLGSLGADFMNDAGLSDVSERTEDTLDSSPSDSQKFQKLNSNVISAMVHTRRKKPSRPSLRSVSSPDRLQERLQRRSASPEIERAPHSELAIVDCSMENNMIERQHSPPSIGEPAIRRKLYFNPVFFETEHLKDPPPAAIEFLLKIREVMSIAKEKMTNKRFIPSLSDIPEEESYHSIDLGWDIPCARRGRRFSAISLKRENSRRALHCGGCPGCDNREPIKPTLTRSLSCKSCVSDDFKQRIVRKWLDEVPSPDPRSTGSRPVKSIAKVSGTPRVVEPKKQESIASSPELSRAKSPYQSRVNSPEPNLIKSTEPKSIESPVSRRIRSPEPIHKITPELKRTKSPIVLHISSPESTPRMKRVASSESMRVCSPELRIRSPEPPRSKTPISEDESKLKPFKMFESINNKKESKTDNSKIKRPKLLHGQEKPTIIHNVPLDQQSTIEGQTIVNPIIALDSNISVQQKTAALVIPEKRSPTTPEKISPSSHASRRIRKRLPPPPPPPTVPPKPTVIKQELEPKDEDASIPLDIKVKMKAVIQELHKCRRVESKELDEFTTETIEPIPPKLVIPVVAADTHYFSDDNMLSDVRKKNFFVQREPFVEMDSLERNMLKRRRFSLACGPELAYRADQGYKNDLQSLRDTLTRSWRDVRKVDSYQIEPLKDTPVPLSRSFPVSEIFIDTSEPLYDNIAKPGPLTIKVRGSPIEARRTAGDEFDPDTLDRKPKKEVSKKRVEKILLKSGGSFKHKVVPHECTGIKNQPEPVFTRKIGSLRQIYEAKNKTQEEKVIFPYYERRGSVPHVSSELSSLVKSVKTSDLIRRIESQKDNIKPPIPPKQRRGSDVSSKFIGDSPPGERRRSPEERERYQQYLRGENLKRSGRRSNRTRSRRTDIRKFYRTEDSGYLSTDSNESKRRANYLMQLKPKSLPEPSAVPPPPTIVRTPILQHIESDTDDMESICDGRSESGGESIETDSVFFGNFDESKQMLAELGMTSYEINRKLSHHEQIDSGFMGETNIILSGDSDSEHRSVISIVTGRDGRGSAASVTKLTDDPYIHSVEC
ncbi:uncharacterized protein LOC126374256 isoform X2 [Pectinophora gossypiella]|nr:uncharacterized protein LOC126374256 isoform X2 [Pectinophora gossypiella]